jgi:hypothetical protein
MSAISPCYAVAGLLVCHKAVIESADKLETSDSRKDAEKAERAAKIMGRARCWRCRDIFSGLRFGRPRLIATLTGYYPRQHNTRQQRCVSSIVARRPCASSPAKTSALVYRSKGISNPAVSCGTTLALRSTQTPRRTRSRVCSFGSAVHQPIMDVLFLEMKIREIAGI